MRPYPKETASGWLWERGGGCVPDSPHILYPFIYDELTLGKYSYCVTCGKISDLQYSHYSTAEDAMEDLGMAIDMYSFQTTARLGIIKEINEHLSID